MTPDLFSMFQISVSPSAGFASTEVKPDATTSSQVLPFSVQRLVTSLCSTAMLRTFIVDFGTSFMHSLPGLRSPGIVYAVGSFGSNASSTTSNAMILSVLVKSRLLALLKFFSSIRWPAANFEKSMRIS